MKHRIIYIYIAFALSIIIIVTISLLLLKNITSIRDTDSMVGHTYEVKNQILKVQANIIEAQNSQSAFFLHKDITLVQPLSLTQINTLRELDILRSLTKDNSTQRQIVKRLKENISNWYQTLYIIINNVTNDKPAYFAADREKANEMLQQIMLICTQMDKIETSLLKKRKDEKSAVENAAPQYLRLILLVSCFFQLISFLIIIQAFKRRQIHQSLLEHKIKELNATNAELEQITFVASHDLQEPLRKIRTFSDKLMRQYNNILNEEGGKIIEKILASAQRMQELLNDLINYTHVTKNEEKVVQINLKNCFDEVCKDFKEVIKQKNAVIRSGNMPIVTGHYKQLYLLFYHLLDNALKFSKPDIAPVIHIVATEVEGNEFNSSDLFTKITFSDNGIGFEEQFGKKIFVIFKRLHAADSALAGKGIGLAICKKVMTNHNGYIAAKAEEGVGAAFDLYFPINAT